ncbi:MAG: ethylammeline chlorohydrolase [Betaproteobacteria bacterium]|nr:MAG: ethylammeline chlorohydrolase [Betaproteobacteria bacterium]
MVDIHSHPTSEPGNKGLLEELGSPRLGQSSLYEFMPVFRIPPDAAPFASRYAIAEMLRSGVTTYCDLSMARDGWVEQIAATGIRAVLAPMFKSAIWRTRDGHSVEYEWDEAGGYSGMKRALEIIDEAERHPSGRLSGLVSPAQLDTCTRELLRDAQTEAKRRKLPVQIHAAQSVVEFNEITRRHGMTPIEFLDDVGLLDGDLIIAHCIFLNDHPWIHWPQARDFARLEAAKPSVAHCPNVFWRRGIALNYFRRYVEAGITMGLGTDTFPHNFVDEMRTCAMAARLIAGDFTAASTHDIFNAATVGGAKALGRDDIGRIAVGAKADLVLIDTQHPLMHPLREPLRSLIYTASDRPIRDVYVGGEQVVRDGEVQTIDIREAAAKLSAAQEITIAGVRQRDWANRTIEDMSPMVFPVVQ